MRYGFQNCINGASVDDYVPFDYTVTGSSATRDFILCSMMRNLLVIFVAALGQSSRNVSVQRV